MPKDKRYGEVPPDEELELLEPNTLIIENEALRQGFTVVPNYILRNPNVSVGAKTVYGLLLSYAWEKGSCFPGQLRLASNLGLTDRMVRNYLNELKEKGYIQVIQRGLGRTNIYIIKDVTRPEADRKYISGQERKYIADPDRQHISDKQHTEEQYTDTTTEDVVVASSPQKPIFQNFQKQSYSNNSGGEPSPSDEKISLLVRRGMARTVAKRLASRHAIDRIREKIEFLDYLLEHDPSKVKNPVGWLRTAIEEDYGRPDGFKTEAELQEEQAEKERRRLELEKAFQQRDERRAGTSWSEYVVDSQSVSQDLIDLTTSLQQRLESQLSEMVYKTRASQLMILEAGRSSVKVAVPTKANQDWIKGTLKKRFLDALTSILGRRVDMELEVITLPSPSEGAGEESQEIVPSMVPSRPADR